MGLQYLKQCLWLFTLIAVITVAVGQNEEPSTPTPVLTTTPPVEIACAMNNDSCEPCVKNPKCLWCPTRSDMCVPYPTGQIIPHKSYCDDLAKARWGVCWLNYKAMLITMGVIAGIIFLSISCCCIYCCCCRSKAKARKRYQQEEAKTEREDDERKAKHAERRTERQSKYDEIRQKYGLVKDDNPYQRFDDE